MPLHCLAGVEPALPEHETEHHEASYVWMYGGTGQDVGGKERVGVKSILIFEVKLPEVVVVGGVGVRCVSGDGAASRNSLNTLRRRR
uniref:Uncharacterized protein n=1 Tax=Oryza barthii TaxID=65489 RepID=A0A0D3GZI8_9ORYZ